MQGSINVIRHKRQTLGLSQAKLAELSQVPQHLVSAYELGKADLPPEMLSAITEVLSDDRRVEEIARRKKRYQQHRYEKVSHVKSRVDRASQTQGNIDYIRELSELSDRHKSMSRSGLRSLSLFSGCGGFSLGFSAAEFDVVGYLELDAGLRKIYQNNFPNSRMLGGDITSVSNADLSNAGLNTIDVILGGPPCQGFSLSGKRKVDDPRNTLFQHYLRFVDHLKPKVAVLENVRLLTSMKSPSGTLVKDEICGKFKKHGYQIEYFEVNAKDYGVPQHRDRVVFVAVRGDLDFSPSIPQPTQGIERDLFSQSSPYRTLGDACSDLAYIESGEESDDPSHSAVRHPSHVIKWLWDVKEGHSAHENEDRQLRPPSGYNTTYKRQIWNQPASTVQTTFGMISGCRNVHPIATRSLTIREAARIQSFPDDFQYVGKMGTIRTGIGNAVPPLLSFAIAAHVRKHLS